MFNLLSQISAEGSFDALNTLREAFQSMGRDILGLLPKLLVAIVIVFVGWVIATTVSRMIRGTFKRAGFDKLFQQSGMGKALGELGIHPAAGAIASRLSYWLLLLFTMKAAADSAGMADFSTIILAVFKILPKIAIALIILTFGIFVADLLRRTVAAALSRLGLEYANTLASMIFGLVLVIVLTVALAQLGIQADLLISCVQIILMAAAFALALGMGLGMKEVAAALIAGIYARDVFKPGAKVTLDGETCELAGVGPLTAKLQRSDGSLWIVPNIRLTRETLSARPAPPEEDC
jgi:small-conductance mechanosensitive channel